MSLPMPVNAAVDIYRGFSATSPYPPVSANPAVQGVGGHLRHHVRNGRFGSAQGLKWTHVLSLPDGIDVRSAYNSQLNTWQPANADTILLPDYPIPGWCTAFLVVLVQRIRGGAVSYQRAYLDRMQPRQGSCKTTGCCPDPLPSTIHATVPAGTGCPCLDGTVVPLVFSSVTQSWSGSAVVCASETLTIDFRCAGTSCEDATLGITLDNHGTVDPVPVVGGCSCTPLHMEFSGIDFPIQGAECDGPVTVVVTE
ncbi:hypothetical protein AYO44_10500 [Planctomycetaceae bacterium SCGC AG-212-F19]|nr:hypothetical protein AYO44_10500 [Planctomycetaceae bacterium SCGC AG-212-F19]